MSAGFVLVLSGPSGVGKGAVHALLRDRLPHCRLSVSVTTRPPRAGETDGVDYVFVDDERFRRLVEEGAFLEHAVYAGHRYGTLRA
ncbi:MAG: guanylate kinase, partial [Nitriliruptoraceae bacterium]